VAPGSPPGLRDLPALEALRRIWLQQYDRCSVPGLEELRWRTRDEQPPSALLIHSPYDLEARYSSKRHTHRVGYKVHLTETCDANQPDLITQVITTPASAQDRVMGPTIQQDLADQGYHLQAFVIDWEAQQAHCPQGYPSVNWWPGRRAYLFPARQHFVPPCKR
jgi:hypothetical protein